MLYRVKSESESKSLNFIKFVAECSSLKSSFNHVSLGWSLKKRKCGLYITILSHIKSKVRV